MSLKFLMAASACLIVTAVSASSVSESSFSKENDNSKSLSDYWTPERMKNAKELPLPLVNSDNIVEVPAGQLEKNIGDSGDGAPPALTVQPDLKPLFTPKTAVESVIDATVPFNRGTFNLDFSSSQLVPLTADITYPYRTVGKLFFTIPNSGDYVCSASVLRQRIIVTAGHCVHSGSNGNNGFYTNWRFIPAYRDGVAPLQTWDWSYVTVSPSWATGGGTVPNAADYGMIEMRDKVINNVSTRIGLVTGYLGYQTLSLTPNHTHMLGYPCNFDSCQKMHQVTAQNGRSVSPNNVEYGSDMRGGSSGGPWIQNFGVAAVGQTGGLNAGMNRIVGITSYGYVSTDPKVQGSSNPNNQFTDILNLICAHQAGNCS